MTSEDLSSSGIPDLREALVKLRRRALGKLKVTGTVICIFPLLVACSPSVPAITVPVTFSSPQEKTRVLSAQWAAFYRTLDGVVRHPTWAP